MKADKGAAGDRGELRRNAELRFRASRGVPVANGEDTAPELPRLVHELQVHQIELEMQNEELRRARTEVEEGLARYTELYDFAPVGYLTLGRDGSIRQANLAGARLLGLERSRLLGMGLADLVAVESRRTLDPFLANIFGSQIPQFCELVLRSQGSTPTAVESVGTVSRDGQECRVTLTDISARKRLEQERSEMQKQLERAHRMEAIGTLAGGIAHDFNNILAGIQGNLSLLELDLGERPDVREMKELVGRGADLTRQLLGFACCGKYDVRPIDLARVVAKTSFLFGSAHKNITIEQDIMSDLPAVLMDRSQLDQVMLNLMGNAAQAMPDGGQLRLRAERVELAREDAAVHGVAPALFVKLVVADSGVGMDAATRARIFDPFFTTKPSGHGLGLASV